MWGDESVVLVPVACVGNPDVCLDVTLTALAAGRGLAEVEGKTCAALGLSAETFLS